MNTAIFLLLAAAALVTLGGAAAEPPPPPQMGCTDELVRFSPCLPYVSSPPNNLSDSVRPKCCDAFSSSLESGAAVCLCYLIQDPAMLGFPVNDTRVLSLPSVCPLRGNSTNIWSATFFESLCSGSPELPPLRSTTISGISSPPDSGTDNPSSPLMGTTPNSTTNSSTQPGNSSSSPPSSAVEPARVSGATKQTNSINAWFLPALMSFQSVFLHFLQLLDQENLC